MKNKAFKALLECHWYKLSSFAYKANLSLFCALLGAVMIVVGCGTVKYVPIQSETKVETVLKDSTIYHLDTVFVEIPREYYRDYTALLDTLYLESATAISRSYVDTTFNALRGELKAKDTVLKKEIVYKERVVYRDSVVVEAKEIPIEVEKVVTKIPKVFWWSVGFNILIILLVILKLYFKLKP